jgi:uncharacterized protein (TIGR04255 family)
MEAGDLKNKPLVEAILEVRWQLKELGRDAKVDPHYKLLVGRLFDRVRESYPCHEELPSAEIPDEITGYMPKHRFRARPEGWPLIQVGPGILTLNDTEGYTWSGFRTKALEAVTWLFDAHPDPPKLVPNRLLLRYIDAVAHDYTRKDVLGFLKEKMGVAFALPSSLFEGDRVCSVPTGLNWHASFKCTQPPGSVHLRIATGQRYQEPSLIWETQVRSFGTEVPKMPGGFDVWLDASHEITHTWFFKLIEGDLERSFRGE